MTCELPVKSFNMPKNKTLTRIVSRKFSRRSAARSGFNGIICRVITAPTKVRVRYAETDQMGIVYHANYLIWMEVARVDYCRSIGFVYKDMESLDGVLLAVVEANCRYLSPSRFDDEITIRISLLEANTRMVRFGYDMEISGEGRKIARGETKHLFLGRDLRPVRLPEKYRRMFRIVESAQ